MFTVLFNFPRLNLTGGLDMKLTIFVVLLCGIALAEKARFDNYRVYRVQIENEEQLELMKHIEANPNGVRTNQCLHGNFKLIEQSNFTYSQYEFWHEPQSIGHNVELVVPPHKFGEWSEFIEKFELQTVMMISNLQE